MNFLRNREVTGDFVERCFDNRMNKFDIAERLCKYTCDKIHILSQHAGTMTCMRLELRKTLEIKLSIFSGMF